jgi:hypothetical protein
MTNIVTLSTQTTQWNRHYTLSAFWAGNRLVFRRSNSVTTIWSTSYIRIVGWLRQYEALHISDGVRRFRQYEAPHISDGVRRFRQYEAPHVSEACARIYGYTSSSLKWYHCRWERWSYIITNTWPKWTKRSPNCLVWLDLFSSVFLQMQHNLKDKDSSTLEQFVCLAY